jgi:hypothetical protein
MWRAESPGTQHRLSAGPLPPPLVTSWTLPPFQVTGYALLTQSQGSTVLNLCPEVQDPPGVQLAPPTCLPLPSPWAPVLNKELQQSLVTLPICGVPCWLPWGGLLRGGAPWDLFRQDLHWVWGSLCERGSGWGVLMS